MNEPFNLNKTLSSKISILFFIKSEIEFSLLIWNKGFIYLISFEDSSYLFLIKLKAKISFILFLKSPSILSSKLSKKIPEREFFFVSVKN